MAASDHRINSSQVVGLPGAGLASLITGAGAIGGTLVVARLRIVVLVIGTLLVTVITIGWLASLRS